jgi:segregation and condensation protein B
MVFKENSKRHYSMSQKNTTSDSITLEARIEALLFTSPAATTISHLAQSLETTPRNVEKAIEKLDTRYLDSGLRVQRFRGRVQLTTAPETAEDVERFLGLSANTRLSRAALEALAVVAYQQPVTRPQVDAIRGVNSDSVLRTLLHHGLIEEAGRAEAAGRPILYTLTPEFLQHFGLNSLEDLPPLDGEPGDSEEAKEEPDAEKADDSEAFRAAQPVENEIAKTSANEEGTE